MSATATGDVMQPLLGLRAALDLAANAGPLGATIGGLRVSARLRTATAGTDEIVDVIFAARVTGARTDVGGPIVQQPHLNPHEDWLMWCPVFIGGTVGDTADMWGSNECVGRSMRKMEEAGEDLLLQVSTSSATAVVNIDLWTTTLLILP